MGVFKSIKRKADESKSEEKRADQFTFKGFRHNVHDISGTLPVDLKKNLLVCLLVAFLVLKTYILARNFF